MPRHSKNNTASSVFTYHEANSLEYGTKRQRIGRDSFRDYNACFLCLQTARDPVACPQGHLACRECMYESILQQKKSIKREQRLLEQKLLGLQEKKQREKEEAKLALLDEFEKTQTSMLGHRKRTTDTTAENEGPSKKATESVAGSDRSSASRELVTTGSKRKLELDREELESIAQKDIERASKKLAEYKAEASKAKLPSFWLPTMTPEAELQLKDEIKPINTQTMCNASKERHPVSLKSLIEVKFQTEPDNKEKNVCPVCLKAMSNSMKLSVMRGCGHVVCNPCTDRFIKKSKKCHVCEAKVKSKDIVDMSPEGTGFVGGSTTALAEKVGVAFQ